MAIKELIKAEVSPIKVDGNTGQIIETKPSMEEIVSKTKTYMDAKEKKVFFNGKRYAEYDDFMYIGTFYGLHVKTFEPTYVEIGGRHGFKAKAMVIDEKQNEVGRAESFCLDDEPNWRSKPLFQLASMAQTRAGAKALSNLFRPIVRLTGYEATPAEEMTDDEKIPKQVKTFDKDLVIGQGSPPADDLDDVSISDEEMSEEVAARPLPDELANLSPAEIQDTAQNYKRPYEAPVKKPGTISEKQGKLLYAKRRAAKIPDAAWKSFVKDRIQVEHDRDIPWKAMDECIAWIDRYQAL